MTHILVIDDDWLSVKMTAFILNDAGYRVSKAFDPRNALKVLEHDPPNLILLDIGLPARTGFALCRQIRSASDVPIIFLSGSRDPADRVKALEAGGDDCIGKPFEPAELLARMVAVLRRADRTQRTSRAKLTIGDLSLDPVSRLASFANGREIELTPIEFQIVHTLARQAGQLVSDAALMRLVWGAQARGRNLLTVYIYRLRAKLWPGSESPIATLRGQGYMFMPAGAGRVRERVVGEAVPGM